MVNNYTKNALVPRAEGKKYNREHRLSDVYLYSQAGDVVQRPGSLIRRELDGDRPVEDGYRAFLGSLDGALSSTAKELERYEDTDKLADAAVHFGLLSYAAGLVSRRYVAQLRSQTPEMDKAERKKASKARKEHKTDA